MTVDTADDLTALERTILGQIDSRPITAAQLCQKMGIDPTTGARTLNRPLGRLVSKGRVFKNTNFRPYTYSTLAQGDTPGN